MIQTPTQKGTVIKSKKNLLAWIFTSIAIVNLILISILAYIFGEGDVNVGMLFFLLFIMYSFSLIISLVSSIASIILKKENFRDNLTILIINIALILFYVIAVILDG